MLVLDASITFAWLFDDESSAIADAVFERVMSSGGHVPTIWGLEVANTLIVAERRKRITRAQLLVHARRLQTIPLQVDTETMSDPISSILPLALRWNLTVYDAAYLELAIRRALPLATLDERLRAAAASAGIALYAP